MNKADIFKIDITCVTTSGPNKKPAPLGLTPHPWISVIKHNQHITVATRWMAYPQDQTTAGHTLDHHEELLVSYLLYESVKSNTTFCS